MISLVEREIDEESWLVGWLVALGGSWPCDHLAFARAMAILKAVSCVDETLRGWDGKAVPLLQA
jgi:hypothetical protein